MAVGSAMSPVATWDPVSGNAYLTPAASSVWGSTPDYALQSVWGNTILSDGSDALWGSQDEPWVYRFPPRSPFGVTSRFGVTNQFGATNLFGVTSPSGAINRFGELDHRAAQILTIGEK